MTFAEELKAERLRLGLTQAEAAGILETSKSALEKWEAGTKRPAKIAQEGALARLAKMQSARAAKKAAK